MKLALAVLILLPLVLPAQELPDSKGTDFWFCFMPNYHNNGYDNPAGNDQDSLFVFVAASKPTNVALRFTPHDGRPPQELRARIEDPRDMLIFKMSYYGVELKGITAGGYYYGATQRHTQRPVPYSLHLTSDEEVTVYALNHAEKTSDAFLVLPTDALGKDYYIVSYNTDVYADGANTPSQFAIVATEDSTVVEFVRITAPTTDGPVNRVLLRQGEVYLVQANIFDERNDLTGTRIKSNRPIAVFAGHQRVRVPLQSRDRASSRDCLIEQLPPINTWGRSALLVNFPDPPDELRLGPDRFRIIAARDSTVIYRDSVPLVTLQAGQYYEADLISPHSIHANRPILVGVFRHTSSPTSMGNTLLLGDPFLMIIPPTEQFQSSYRFICPRLYEDSVLSSRRTVKTEVYKYHYVAIVAPDTALATINLDGRMVPASSFRPIPKSRYFYTWVRIDAGVHTISASAPIGIYVFGYGYADSYGYVGGMSYRRYDFDPPVLSTLSPCPPYRLVVYDTLPGDSRVDVVRIIEDSTRNLAWKVVRSSLLPQDSIVLELSLLDPYEDGMLTLIAQDAEQFTTRAQLVVPGVTLRVTNTQGISQRPPVHFRYRSATQRSSCFPLTITNVGKLPQTILRAFTREGIITSKALPAVVVPRDTISLRVCYRTEQTQVITDTLWIQTPCTTIVAATFTIEFIVDTAAPRIQRNTIDCPGVHVLTIAEQGYTETGIASIAVVDSFNVVIRLGNNSETYADPAEVQYLNISHRDWRLDGWYRIQVTDSSGNISTIAGTFEGHTVMIVNRDSLSPTQQFVGYSGQFFCDTVELYNFGRYPKVFDRITARGVEFSIPPSYMPLTLAPGERVRVPICAFLPPYDSRGENMYADTFALVVGCYERRMPITIRVQAVTYQANSSCDVHIVSSALRDSVRVEQVASGIRGEFAHPTSGSLELYTLTGRRVHMEHFNDAAFSLNFDGLPRGTYWLIIRTSNGVITLPLLWIGN
ncbi:MAG: IgGFc-binding protein [Candidatus Kapabacteria bacterium]|nr:IgGFc-binding protein [Candidatus Kapabacteria bacterium]